MTTRVFKGFIFVFALLLLIAGCKSKGVKVAIYKGGTVYLSKQVMEEKAPADISKRIDHALKDRLLLKFAKENGIYDKDKIRNNAEKFKYQIAYSYLLSKFQSKINITEEMIKKIFETDLQYKGKKYEQVKELIRSHLMGKAMEKAIGDEIYKYKPDHNIKINKEYLDFTKYPPNKSSLVIATIDDEIKITNNMVNNRLRYLNEKETPEQSLNYLINISIIRLASKKYINNKEVQKKLRKYYDNMALRYMKLTYIFEKNPLSMEVLKKFYDDHIKDFYSHPELVHIRHILFDSKEEAQKVLANILKSKDPQKTFFENARKYARGPEILKENAGDLGDIPFEAMPESFSKAAFSLKNGEIYKDVIKTYLGYHLIRCEGRKKPEVLDFAKNKQKVLQDMKNYIKITKFNEFLKGLIKEYGVKVLYSQYKGVYKDGQKK
ncbi:peptidyl-prolyl cis-trans isomerase [bacterium]|nr:peptidyl-prolyl cis-trans isomerase [bacterium]